VAEHVAIHAQQDGAQHLLGQRTQRGALPADRAPGDHQPDDADHEEQQDEVMQAAAVAMSPMYIPGRLRTPSSPPPLLRTPDAGRRTPDAGRRTPDAGHRTPIEPAS
jgi:hypothetical protein